MGWVCCPPLISTPRGIQEHIWSIYEEDSLVCIESSKPSNAIKCHASRRKRRKKKNTKILRLFSSPPVHETNSGYSKLLFTVLKIAIFQIFIPGFLFFLLDMNLEVFGVLIVNICHKHGVLQRNAQGKKRIAYVGPEGSQSKALATNAL